jgi:hypothetical protein
VRAFADEEDLEVRDLGARGGDEVDQPLFVLRVIEASDE